MSQALSLLAPGSLLLLKENGNPEEFIVLENDHYGKGSGTTLLRKKVAGVSAFQHTEYRNGYNSPAYTGSFVDLFCNGSYLLQLEEDVRKNILPVSLLTEEGFGSKTIVSIFRKGFALSGTECGETGSTTLGSAFSWLNSDQRRAAKLSGVSAGSGKYDIGWWLRSMGKNTDSFFAAVDSSGYIAGDIPYFYGDYGIRPAFNLPGNTQVSSSPEAGGAYILEELPLAGNGLWIKQDGAWRKAL